MKRMTRRSALAGTSALALLLSLPAIAKGPRKRPNILFILADDWSWQNAEAADRIHLHMPVIDRIRRMGVEFTNAYAASPTCTASRGAILTGQWPWRLEEGANLVSILPAHFPVYPDLLEEAGYHVGYCRKGWGPGKIAPGRTRNPAGTPFTDFDAFLAKRVDDAPFCFWFGTHDPHRPYVKGEGVGSGIDLASIAVPPYLPDTPEVRSDIADYRFCLERLDQETGALLDRLEGLGELDNTIIVVTGDNGWPFPRGKATLYDAGWHVPLMVMWRARIAGNQRSDALVSLIDLAPTFLEAAGIPQLPQMNGRSLMPVLQNPRRKHRTHVLGCMERHMDGRAIPGQGYPMRAIRTHEMLYIRNFRPDRWPAGDPPRHPTDTASLETKSFAGYADIDAGPTKADMVRGEGADYNRLRGLAMGKRPASELYDVRTDPYELTNLIHDTRYSAVASSLDARLIADLKNTSDPRVIDGGDVFDKYPSYSDPGFGRPPNFLE